MNITEFEKKISAIGKQIVLFSHDAAWKRYVEVWWNSCGVIKAADGPAFEKNISRHFRPKNYKETWKITKLSFWFGPRSTASLTLYLFTV
jgi:hypothetical protein